MEQKWAQVYDVPISYNQAGISYKICRNVWWIVGDVVILYCEEGYGLRPNEKCIVSSEKGEIVFNLIWDINKE